MQDALSGLLVPDGDDAIELGERQGVEQEGVDGAEDGSVSADAEGECDDGDDGEAGPSQEISYCVPNVAEKTLHDRLLLFADCRLQISDLAIGIRKLAMARGPLVTSRGPPVSLP